MKENTVTITANKKDYELVDPVSNWEIYSQALNLAIFDKVAAGKLIFEGCYLGGAENLVDLQKNIPLYSNICLNCATLLEFIEVDIKKNSNNTSEEKVKK